MLPYLTTRTKQCTHVWFTFMTWVRVAGTVDMEPVRMIHERQCVWKNCRCVVWTMVL